jgi:predicted kinase
LPGAGKSTFARLIVSKSAWFDGSTDPIAVKRISLDQWIDGHGGQWDSDLAGEWAALDLKQCEEYMAVFEPLIIVDNVFAHPWEMKPYRDLAKFYKYTCRSLIVENRHEGKSRRFVPGEVIARMARRFKVKLQ